MPYNIQIGCSSQWHYSVYCPLKLKTVEVEVRTFFLLLMLVEAVSRSGIHLSFSKALSLWPLLLQNTHLHAEDSILFMGVPSIDFFGGKVVTYSQSLRGGEHLGRGNK